MSIVGAPGYAAIFAAAAVEGEVVFIAASVMVAAGQLQPLPVLVAGALGAAAGDQFYFYALRGRVSAWLARLKPVAARQAAIITRVRRHQSLMIIALRFSPGLWIAIAAACAYAEVPPLRFSTINTLAAFAWAAALLMLVTKLGPSAVGGLGLSGIWGAALVGIGVLVFGWWLGRDLRSSV